ncbi:DUF4167 domain-containing protein [Temperatibacter marinus]|uniref:DUF4167 domain-containing protein n=1 Tax=Temperatibacter marinus TaxID=1456591 RepID=A0AA52E9W0_9PROT|nr:DUF4167 domain-containing protein [Temperatibacter marinus]WND01382.1 DUF4167 domain-containing protein [Temperatibacter marinus]
MKQNQGGRNKGRSRSTGRNNRPVNKSKNHSAGNRRDNKVKGNPKQLLEKYKTQAREAAQTGDRVQEEYYYQFAEHYQRVINEHFPNQRQNNRQEENPEADEDVSGETQNSEQSDDQSDRQESRNPRSKGRGRGQQRGRRKPSEDTTKETVDPAEQSQPSLEYPEEMLSDIPQAQRVDDTAELVGEEVKKPTRRGRPKKKSPPVEENLTLSLDQSDGDEAA